jgi:hypothetical protein
LLAVVQLDYNNKTTPLYSGPVAESTVVLPMGQFHLYAKIEEEAGAYATYDIDVRFPTVMPDEAQYYEFDVLSKIAYYQSTGNQQRIQQILTAQVQ